MNIAIGNSGIRPLHSVRRHIRQAITALCVGLICLSVGVRISGGAAPASSSSEPSFQSIPAIVLDYQAGEREGLVPDEYGGGFRQPVHRRERLQAARGEYSSSVR